MKACWIAIFSPIPLKIHHFKLLLTPLIESEDIQPVILYKNAPVLAEQVILMAMEPMTNAACDRHAPSHDHIPSPEEPPCLLPI